VKFLVDAQLPPALARLLLAAGHQAEHVQEVGLLDAEDRSIWDHAMSIGAVLVTKDQDFAMRSGTGVPGPTVVWLRIGNASNRALREWLTPLLPKIVALVKAGERLIEVR